ncbi:Iron-sulfur cluster carrier protein [Metallosphaera sp. J1]|uniref:ParA family protein n=1 Tax=Metallosphaera javensis (ex Hofmann et al. 2022) TaxID=99938 RepID=UPI001EDE3F25|nr:ParA family protein [Metallosphaera javensis (ex Hofmann et al. 2022)]MCG3109773.1 Iron-sulfur cluster carrier protein [Metallosphaera javensis (ex Hofmann et al. 2022)]
MRIIILGNKGGVGKSTVGLLLAKRLCELGKTVLLVDRDQIGYASWLVGIKRKGLIASVVDREEGDYFVEKRIGSGNLQVLKFYGDGPRLREDVRLIISDPKLKRAFSQRYQEVLSLGHDFIILDNKSTTFPSNEEIKLELDAYTDRFPNTRSYRVFVTDPFQLNIENTISFARKLNEEEVLHNLPVRVVGQTLVINMIPTTRMEEMRNLVKELGNLFSSVIFIPFLDELFSFKGSIDQLPEVDEINDLVTLIQRVEMFPE